MLVDLELFRREQSGRRSVIDKVDGIQVDIREVLSSMRELLHDLRGESRQLSEAFTDAVARLLSDFERQTGIEGRLTVAAGWPTRLRPAAAANLGGIVCEALANVRRHSEATHVAVALEPHGESGVAITITDDGRGLEPTVAARPGLGIAGMRERALLLGAVLLIQSLGETGTTISVVVPNGVVPESVQP